MNKKVPLWFVLLLLWFACMGALTFGWAVWRIKTSRQGPQTKMDRLVIKIASYPSLVKESFKELNQKSIQVRPNLFPDVNGFKAENKYIDSNYVLLSTFETKVGQSVVKLIRLSDQKVMHEWIPDFNAIINLLGKQNKSWPDQHKADLRLYHPLLFADGSIVFNDFESPLIKIDKNSKLVWYVNGIFHHSVEADTEGNIWAPSVIDPPGFLPHILREYKDDAITEVSPDGKVLYRRSVAQILVDNGYRTLLLGVGPYEKDLLHMNEIQPALTSGKYWMKGDLLLSLRNRSTVFLYRPSANKILWLKTGPWLNQHDADFIDSARISIFGNNMVRIFGDHRLLDGVNEEYIFNFDTGTIETPYTEFLKSANVASPTEGRSVVLPDGNLFVEETDNNRLLLGNTKNILWQYVNRIDNNSVGAVSWSRYITSEEFKKLTFLNNK